MWTNASSASETFAPSSSPLHLSKQAGILQKALDLKDEKHFRKAYLSPSLDSGLVEMTRPETPRSSKQRYRLTALGKQWLELNKGTSKN